jgi:hypothetical protein
MQDRGALVMADRPVPATLKERLRPIDDQARSGRLQMVFGAGEFALARWCADLAAWLCGTEPLPYEPELYLP